MLMGAAGVAGYEIFIYLYRTFILQSNMEIFIFIRTLMIETVFNTLIIIIVYPIMQKVGYKIEATFKNSQILTRYF